MYLQLKRFHIGISQFQGLFHLDLNVLQVLASTHGRGQQVLGKVALDVGLVLAAQLKDGLDFGAQKGGTQQVHGLIIQ